MTVHDLPLLNASLNGLSALFILIGLAAIKSDRKKFHILAMSAALLTSALFLTSYVTYHWLSHGVVTPFTHEGWPKTLYFVILFTHIPLAALTLPLVIMSSICLVSSAVNSTLPFRSSPTSISISLIGTRCRGKRWPPV